MKFIKWWFKTRDWEDIGYNTLFMTILLIIISFLYFCLFTFEKYLFSKVMTFLFLAFIVILLIYMISYKTKEYINTEKEKYNKDI